MSEPGDPFDNQGEVNEDDEIRLENQRRDAANRERLVNERYLATLEKAKIALASEAMQEKMRKLDRAKTSKGVVDNFKLLLEQGLIDEEDFNVLTADRSDRKIEERQLSSTDQRREDVQKEMNEGLYGKK